MNASARILHIGILSVVAAIGLLAAPGFSLYAQDPNPARASVETSAKTIGVIGGVSWLSSAEYYRLMNEMVRERLGGLHSAKILMYSIEFGEFSKQERLADRGDWAPLVATMLDAAERLKRGGADFIVIASNTLNSQAPLIEEKVGIPVIHIADATAAAAKEKGVGTVALLGTKYTMEQPFYRERLERQGLKVVVPNAEERDYINHVIFEELCAGQITEESRRGFVRIIERLVKDQGAQAAILGCTEIPLLIKQSDVSVPTLDTTAIHSAAAVKRSLQGQ
ncbi:aspartate/glutamate racemase family protein [uncultured Thiodictyon sp.]|uniref:aspartate/glutamate racemase family protein n=1 Tax=uncultured Thiodictyon sp. TaxID=1846217 RepID=UPI0025EE2D9D|nr:aspartate/glutamate racemase family protein [uncultured Thiodictyon sp.]